MKKLLLTLISAVLAAQAYANVTPNTQYTLEFKGVQVYQMIYNGIEHYNSIVSPIGHHTDEEGIIEAGITAVISDGTALLHGEFDKPRKALSFSIFTHAQMWWVGRDSPIQMPENIKQLTHDENYHSRALTINPETGEVYISGVESNVSYSFEPMSDPVKEFSLQNKIAITIHPTDFNTQVRVNCTARAAGGSYGAETRVASFPADGVYFLFEIVEVPVEE